MLGKERTRYSNLNHLTDYEEVYRCRERKNERKKIKGMDNKV